MCSMRSILVCVAPRPASLTRDDKDVVTCILAIKPGAFFPDRRHYAVHVVGGMGPEDPCVREEEVCLLRVLGDVRAAFQELWKELVHSIVGVPGNLRTQ